MFRPELKPVAKGLATMIPGVYKLLAHARGGGTDSAEYCFSVWAKHLSMLGAHGMNALPRRVAELGPGESLGVGICALLSGATRFYAFDVVEHASTDKNLRLLDQLVQIFKERAGVSIVGWPNFSEHLDAKGFPKLLTRELLSDTVSESRVRRIRAALQQQESDIVIRYVVPWDSATTLNSGAVDLILSHSVLEHVNDLNSTMKSCAMWLSSDGWMSHQVDFSSHGISKYWNGHWQYSDWMWHLVVGGRPYLINRVPVDQLLDIVRQNGFRIDFELRKEDAGGLPLDRLSPAWRETGVTCRSLYFQARHAREDIHPKLRV